MKLENIIISDTYLEATAKFSTLFHVLDDVILDSETVILASVLELRARSRRIGLIDPSKVGADVVSLGVQNWEKLWPPTRQKASAPAAASHVAAIKDGDTGDHQLSESEGGEDVLPDKDCPQPPHTHNVISAGGCCSDERH